MRVLLTSLLCGMLCACGTVQIEEKNFIRPDSLTGVKTTHRLDQAALQAVVPSSSLSELAVPVGGDVALRGVLMQRPQAVAHVLYFGGNAFHIDQSAQGLAAKLSACPVNIIVFDYRGYGRSSGAPTVANMQQDALTLFDHVNAGFPGQVFVHGHSLGSFVAAYVAQQRPVKGLVLEATANHALDWARANVPWYASPFVSIKVSESLRTIDNTVALAGFTQPSLILAGSADKVTPAQLGLKVYAALPGSNKQMLVVEGGRHSDLLDHGEAVAAYCKFLQ